MIIPVYKPIGSSTHLLAKKAGDLYQTKATHTGTLDPMADGVVVVLTGEDRFKKSELSDWKKTYEFEILWGVSNDTHDLLGLTTEIDEVEVDDKKIAAALLKFTGKITQQLPKFSAKRIDGKSYFDKAKQQVAFTPESKEIQIHQLKLIGSDTIGKQQLQKKLQKINLVKGDFRQAEIHNNWQKIISQLPEKLIISKFTANTSKRAYIRSLVRDISQSLNIPATTYSLTRTANGKFAIKDCVCLM